MCNKKSRVNANDLASRKCAEYASLLPELDARGGGLQAPHDPSKTYCIYLIEFDLSHLSQKCCICERKCIAK